MTEPIATTDDETREAKAYKVVCISLYHSDIELLDARVDELKRRGWTRANRSHLIRLAIAGADLDSIERTLAAAGMVQRPTAPKTARKD